MAGKAVKAQPGIRQLWGIAKSPELRLTDEELHVLVEGHTGKSSIRDLNRRELQVVLRVLTSMKDSAKEQSVVTGAGAAARPRRTSGKRFTGLPRNWGGTSPQGCPACAGVCLVSHPWNGWTIHSAPSSLRHLKPWRAGRMMGFEEAKGDG